jgi:BTB/POZ domain
MSEQSPRDAGPPFDDIFPGCTVKLRSSDNVDFFVLKPILAKVSNVFNDMFELPVNNPEDVTPLQGDSNRHDIPLIEVTETSTTLEIVLRFCYPVENPDISNLEDIRLLLEARRKYMIEAFDKTIKDSLSRIAESQPFEVFALASRYALEDVANDAAKQTLRHIQNDDPPQSVLKDLTATQYDRLLQYRRDCVIETTTMSPLMWFKSLSSIYQPSPTTSTSCRKQFHFFFLSFSSSSQSLWVPHWWSAYLENALLLLKDRPHSSTVLSTKLLEFFSERAGRCPDCKQEGKDALKEISTKFAQEVEKAIAEARIT